MLLALMLPIVAAQTASIGVPEGEATGNGLFSSQILYKQTP
jgi:hypothetical protein